MAGARKIVSNGKDITAEINKRFISLSLTDEAGQKSDSFTLTLSDDGQIQYPKRESEIDVWLGKNVDSLVYKGRFKVADVSLPFAPFQIVLTATAVTVRGEFTATRDDVWDNVTVKSCVEAIAQRNGLTSAVANDFTAVTLLHREQVAQSDADFLTRLADECDATMKVARGKLVFFNRGDGANVSGNPLPAIPIKLSDTNTGKIKLKGRVRAGSVAAQWRNMNTATTEKVSTSSQAPQKLLPGVYDNAEQALQAATAKLHSLNRREFELRLRNVEPIDDLSAERLINLSGHPREVCNGEWVIKSLTEDQNSSGYLMQIVAAKAKQRRGKIPQLATA